MPKRYEMIFGFVHCRGKTTYHAGYADSEEEALAWVQHHREGHCPGLKVPPEDPIRYCKAAWCPFKRQKPWFDMVVDQTDQSVVRSGDASKKL